MRDILNAPVSTTRFQQQLDAETKKYPGAELRVVWAPTCVESRVVDRAGHERVYRKYPLLGMKTQVYHVGTSYRRDGETIAYHKMGTLIPSNVNATDVAVSHLERVHHSIHIFVIEKKLPEPYAHEQWERKQEMSRAKMGVDIFGPFPSEGYWVWYDDISAHYNGCCGLAAERGIRCAGLYREPDQSDIDRVRQSLFEWYQRPVDTTELVKQADRDWTAADEANEASEDLAMLQELRESRAIDQIAQDKSRVALGVNRPLHTTRF